MPTVTMDNGEDKIENLSCSAMSIGDIGIVTDAPGQQGIVGHVVISGSKELIFPASGTWSQCKSNYRYRKLKKSERVIFSES